MSMIGNTPGVSSQRVITEEVITGSAKAAFTPVGGYSLGYVDVLINGLEVDSNDFTAADGVTVTLATAAAVGDTVKIKAWLPRGLSDGYLKTEADARFLSSNAGAVTAAKLASGAALSNLGFTPVDQSNPIFGIATNAWHYIGNTKINAGAGFIRKAKRFTGNTAQTAIKFRTNYGWGEYLVRIRLHEAGHIGGSYREILLTSGSGINGYLNGASYSPGTNNIQMIGGFGNYSFACVQAGGGVDVGYFETTFSVTPGIYEDLMVDVEFWAITETTSSPGKYEIQFL